MDSEIKIPFRVTKSTAIYFLRVFHWSSPTEHKLKQKTKRRPIMPLAEREDILIFPKQYTFIEKYTCYDGPHYIFQSVSIDQISKSVLGMNHLKFSQ